MALKCGIVGMSGTGKTTVFNCLSKSKVGADAPKTTNLGQIQVPDPRLPVLFELAKSAKLVPTTVEIVDIPGLMKGSGPIKGGAQFLADIRQTDAILHVLRCFDDDMVPHIEGSVNPVRDKEIIDLELISRDLETLEKKVQRLEKIAKSGDKDAKHGIEVINQLKKHMENGESARTFTIAEKDQKYIDDCFLLTVKPVLYVCNVDEASAKEGNAYVENVKKAVAGEDTDVLIIAAQSEAEIAELEEEDDRKEFLKDLGLAEPGVYKLIRAAYNLLNLKTFFTVGPKETHAWTFREGMTAPQAAGIIHSDLERGFIRAEVMKYEDFAELGSEHTCKSAGKFFIEGKNYKVQDGDILNIRFNV
ncbi:MAG: redox-regulated ATPase YchF [Bacteroidetes bacterium]|nr:MAG: redox-regulated ATPase YchF [Bacteroidota bacterium]